MKSVQELKACVDGTHRARQPDETLRWIEPVFTEVGITRLADVTWLDEIGIPVYQAIRPDSRSLSVSQGKGLTPDLAKVSAAMESIELWHAERMPAGPRTASPRQLTGEIGYQVDELNLGYKSTVNQDCVLDWSPAIVIRTGAPTWLPTELLNMDGVVDGRWTVPRFDTTTNGLASGNNLTEALLHGLYEVIERDALARRHPEPRAAHVVDLETVTGPAASLLDTMTRAGVAVAVTVVPSAVGLPVFRARIWSDNLPLPFGGTGCHLDRDVALCRALTEAAQSRATVIAGARDDIKPLDYARAAKAGQQRPAEFDTPTVGLDYARIGTVRQPDLATDLKITADRVVAATGREPTYVDHTRADLGIPVVHVVCPGLRYDVLSH
ncbi:YcaO-like family protein [Plantactinospora sp. GCM10030261]|uniref:YcaO-like family protein n=1 Tax=Plantactinospora sp. GCM10030261 TaxID=3273420 RepID=UPI00360FD65F